MKAGQATPQSALGTLWRKLSEANTQDVADSRAKFWLTVIGDYNLWKHIPYVQTVYKYLTKYICWINAEYGSKLFSWDLAIPISPTGSTALWRWWPFRKYQSLRNHGRVKTATLALHMFEHAGHNPIRLILPRSASWLRTSWICTKWLFAYREHRKIFSVSDKLSQTVAVFSYSANCQMPKATIDKSEKSQSITINSFTMQPAKRFIGGTMKTKDISIRSIIQIPRIKKAAE